MAVYAKGDKFMASVGAGTTRTRRTFATEALALAWELAEDTKRKPITAPGESLPVISSAAAKGWTLQRAYDETFRAQWKGRAGENTARNNAGFALSYFGADTLLEDIIDGVRIADYREWLLEEVGNSQSTVNRKMTSLGTMFTKAIDMRALSWRPKTLLYPETARIRFYSDAEEKAMLISCDRLGLPDLRDFIILGLDTGLRRAEMMGLELNQYHEGSIALHADKTKGQKSRSVELTPRVIDLLNRRIASGHMRVLGGLSDKSMQTQWAKMKRDLGKEDDEWFIPHILRHTCCTRLVWAGVPMPAVQKWMGHARIETTMRYSHLNDAQSRLARDALHARNTRASEAF